MSSGKSNPFSSPSTSPLPGGIGGDGQLASLGQRFVGGLIDGVVISIVSFPAAFGIGYLLGSMMGGGFITLMIASVLGGIVGVLVFLAINFQLLSTKGQTVGKMVMGTRIVSDSGQLLPIMDLILKRYAPVWILSTIPWLGGLIALVNAVLIFRANRKCGHDEIAGTKVVVV